MSNQKIIIIFGFPGAGKGFLSSKLLTTNKFVHYSPGIIMRNILKNSQSRDYMWIKKYLWSGVLVPAEKVKILIEQKINEQNEKIIILDGYPRNEIQAADLKEICEKSKAQIIAIYYLVIDREKAKERLRNRVICSKCQTCYNLLTAPPKLKNVCDFCNLALGRRKDDDKIDVRFRVFDSETMPIILKYAKNNNFFEINALKLREWIPKIKKNLLLMI